MKIFCVLGVCLSVLGVYSLSACNPLVTLQGKSEDLDTEITNRPTTQRIKANVSFHAENGQETFVEGYTSKMSHFKLIYPSRKMLQQAGEASIRRWFMSQEASPRAIIISARIENMYYNDVTDVWNKVKALIDVKVHVRAVVSKEILMDKTYDSGKQYSDFFKIGLRLGVGEQYETQYSRTLYKALLVTLDQAMLDVALSARERGLVQ